MNAETIYEQFVARLEDPESAMGFLEQHFSQSGDGHRLFEVLKMRSRWEMGLPLFAAADEKLSPQRRDALEEGLIRACRKVAKFFFEKGNLIDGWTYLHPIGDEELSKQLLQGIEVDEQNAAAVVDICLYQGVDPAYGYEVLLNHMGTCDGITAYDMQARQLAKGESIELAAVLLNHFHAEVMQGVVADVREQGFEVADTASLGELLDEHAWLVSEGGHHVDATHLASVVRIARQTASPQEHAKGLELCRYGRRLPEDFHFKSDPPFESIYLDHEKFFEALVGKDREQAVAWFVDKAERLEGDFHHAQAVEALIDLQVRCGDRDQAVATLADRMWGFFEDGQIPGSVLEIARTGDQFARLSNKFRESDDFGGFAFARLCSVVSEAGAKKDPPPE